MNDKKPPYFKYAFHNVYNYTLLGGVAAAALLTGNWWLAIVGGGIEALWMVFAPDSVLLQKKVFDKVHEAEAANAAEEAKKKKLAHLTIPDAERYERLDRKAKEIRQLATKNQALTTELLREELAKMEQLLDSFLELIDSSARYEQYLTTVDLPELEQEIERHEKTRDHSKDEERRRLAEKNLAVLEKRRERLAEIKRFVQRAHGQMDLIENSFELLADQIVTMSSPRELGGQLDELIDGVEAVRSTAQEAARFIESVAE